MSLPEIVMVPLSKIRPNPWRDFTLNPIDTEEVKLLEASIEDTKEFWVGVYGRRVAGGFVELAFGHNRLEAAKNRKIKEIAIAVRELSDEDMLVRMVKENEQSNLSFRIALEAVSAAVNALAQGKIEVPKPERTNPKDIRYAPSFIPGEKLTSGSEPEVPYTASTLAKYLGGAYVCKNKGVLEPQNAVRAALSVLELRDRHVEGATLDYFRGMTLLEIINNASRMKKRHERVQLVRVHNAEERNKILAEQAEIERKAKETEKAAESARLAQCKADAIAKKYKEDEEAQEEKKRKAEERDKAEEDAKEARKLADEEDTYVKTRTAEMAAAERKAEEDAVRAAAQDLAHKVISKANSIAKEHDALWELAMSVANSAIGLADRDRVMNALREAARRCDDLANRMEVSLKGTTKLPKKAKEKK